MAENAVKLKQLTNSFVNTRARLQRLKDAKFFSGWIQELNTEAMRVRVTNASSLEPGEVFMVEAHGPAVTALYKASLAISSGTDLTFNVLQPITYQANPAADTVRYAVSGMSGSVAYDGIRVSVEALDVSAGGVGVLSQQSIPRSTKVEVVLHTPYGEMSALGHIRYCRPDTEALGSYRVGIKLEELGRLERARWNRLFELEAA